MHRIYSFSLFFILLFLAAGTVQANSQQYEGSDGAIYTVRYFAIPTTSLDRDILQQYEILPSRSTGLLQVSIEKNLDGETSTPSAFIRGTVRDDLSEKRGLEFQRVRVANITSNMAPFWFSAGKPYTFELEVQADPNSGPFQLRFVQTLYGD